jgi:hypothetical protein
MYSHQNRRLVKDWLNFISGYNQVWLNLPRDDNHLGKFKNKKKILKKGTKSP